MIKYQKIITPFERDTTGTKKLIYDKYINQTVEYLKDCIWECTEKIDGTNIGIVWDGYSVSFQSRTENTGIPYYLQNTLHNIFGGDVNEQLFEQKFGSMKVILFGEGYGYKIQKRGRHYIPNDHSFILFDVYIPEKDLWMKRESIEDIAQTFNVKAVPIVMHCTLEQAIDFIKIKPKSLLGDTVMEGLVCKPLVELRDRMNERIVVKVKVKDFTDYKE